MKNADAIELFERLYINVIRKELDPADETYQKLKSLMEAGLRTCAVCSKSNDQEGMIKAFSSWAHIDCAHEHHMSCQVDPTTRRIGETDGEYKVRMDQDFPDFC